MYSFKKYKNFLNENNYLTFDDLVFKYHPQANVEFDKINFNNGYILSVFRLEDDEDIEAILVSQEEARKILKSKEIVFSPYMDSDKTLGKSVGALMTRSALFKNPDA